MTDLILFTLHIFALVILSFILGYKFGKRKGINNCINYSIDKCNEAVKENLSKKGVK